LGIGPNPQSPIPNPQSPIIQKLNNNYYIKFKLINEIKIINLILIKIKINEKKFLILKFIQIIK